MVDPANRQAEVTELLQAGIAAAKAGQRVAARALLRQVVEIDSHQVLAWMWLSGLVDNPGEQIVCLEHVVTLDPENTRAKDALEKLQQQRMENLLQQGIAAAEVGQDARAQELLTRIVETDDGNALAWFWLGKVVPSVEEKIICFENVLTLVPGHIEAQAELDQLQSVDAQEQRYASLASEILEEDFAGRDIAAETVSDEIPEEKHDSNYASEASILFGDEFVKRYTLPEWEAAPTAITDVFADEYLCPYCAEPTQPKDRRCPSCGGQLWIREKKRFAKNNSLNFMLILMGEAAIIVLSVALIIFWLRTLDPQIAVDIPDALTIFEVYLGSRPTTPAFAEIIYPLLPRWFVLLNLIPPGLAILTLLGVGLPLAIRQLRNTATFFAVQTFPLLQGIIFSIDLLFVIFSKLVPAPPPGAGPLELISLKGGLSATKGILYVLTILLLGFTGMVIFLVRNLVDEYLFNEYRILLRVDHDVRRTEVGLRERGLLYYQNKMWALSAIHLRKAAALRPNDAGLWVSLATAYIKLKRPAMAEDALQEARNLAPDMPELQEMAAILEAMK